MGILSTLMISASDYVWAGTMVLTASYIERETYLFQNLQKNCIKDVNEIYFYVNNRQKIVIIQF